MPNNCYLNAYINMRNAYKDKGLKLVIGSLGINKWFEYGGKNWGMAEFMLKVDGYTSDSHCWLEDKDGNVYDCLFSQYELWVAIRTDKPMRRKGVLEGVSKADLLKDGIEYVPAPKDVQTALFLINHKFLRYAYDGLVKGTNKWVNGNLVSSFLSFEDYKLFQEIQGM
jgi:hypothetical protein